MAALSRPIAKEPENQAQNAEQGTGEGKLRLAYFFAFFPACAVTAPAIQGGESLAILR